MNPIINLYKYTTSMKTTLSDKLFFTELIESDIYVDFGCADGSTLKALQNIYPNKILIGYDINEDMIQLAKNNTSRILYFGNQTELIEYLNKYKHLSKCLILNSVLHEVYTYSSKEELEEFYKFIFSDIFDYISIRDMMCSDSTNISVSPLLVSKIYQSKNLKQVIEFENVWGKLNTIRQLMHYLLKYRYIENWSRELYENYLPITIEEFLQLIPKNLNIDYFQRFFIPFIHNKILEDFGIDFCENTHIKLILHRV